MRRLRVAALLAVAAVVMAACSSTEPESGTSDSANAEASQGEDLDSGDSGEAAGEEGDEGESKAEGANEAEEEMAQAQERVDAMNEAIAAGRFGGDEPITGKPSDGWNGQVLLNKKTDDWEPAVAADRHKHFVYALTTRYGAKPICPVGLSIAVHPADSVKGRRQDVGQAKTAV